MSAYEYQKEELSSSERVRRLFIKFGKSGLYKIDWGLKKVSMRKMQRTFQRERGRERAERKS